VTDGQHQDPARARLLAELQQQPSPTRRDRQLRNLLLLMSAVVVPLVVWWQYGGVRIQSRPTWYVVGTSVGWTIVAAWAVWGSLSPGPTMLGRSRRWMRWVVVLTPTVLFLWMLGWDFVDADRLEPWPERWGKKCLNLTMLLGAWPLLALLLMRRGSEPLHPGTRGAAIGAAVGCSTGVLIDLWCPITDPMHMLLGHILPLVILILAGLLLGRWLLRMRQQHRERTRGQK
jgi:hypothetical protein